MEFKDVTHTPYGLVTFNYTVSQDDVNDRDFELEDS